MKSRILVKTIAALFILGSTGAVAHEGMHEKISSLTPEQRQKMADLHVKMADCLRSDRPMNDCHQELAQNCRTTMGTDGPCPMGKHAHKWKDKKATSEQGDAAKAEKRPSAE